jgi:lysozyme
MNENSLALLKHQEGFRAHLYKDTRGVNTIGYGTNIDQGITEPEAQLLLQSRVQSTETALFQEGWYQTLSEVRKAAILSMAYQLGIEGFRKFRATIAALAAGDFATAAYQMMSSRWAHQTPERAQEVADMVKNDSWPDWMQVATTGEGE